MNYDQKVYRILKASKIFPKKKIDPKGKGSTINKLEQGKPVTENKINEIYNLVLELEAEQTYEQKNKQIPEQKTEQNERQNEKIPEQKTEQNRLDEIEAKLQRIVSRLTVLEWKFKEYKQNPVSIEEPKQKQSIYGFSIKRTAIQSAGRTYQVYKAFRSIKGIGLSIYIGQDISKAKKKITSYLKKNRKKLSHVLPVILEEYPTILD